MLPHLTSVERSGIVVLILLILMITGYKFWMLRHTPEADTAEIPRLDGGHRVSRTSGTGSPF